MRIELLSPPVLAQQVGGVGFAHFTEVKQN